MPLPGRRLADASPSRSSGEQALLKHAGVQNPKVTCIRLEVDKAGLGQKNELFSLFKFFFDNLSNPADAGHHWGVIQLFTTI